MNRAIRPLPLLAIALGALLGACSKAPPPAAAPATSAAPAVDVQIRGELAYRERIAMPPHSQARVALYAADAAQPLARSQFDIGDRQVPVPFTLAVPAKALQAGQSYRLQGAIVNTRNQPLWQGEMPIVADASAALSIGTVWLRAVPVDEPAATSTTYRAGGNEPGWSLRIGPQGLHLDWAYGEQSLQAASPEYSENAGERQWQAHVKQHAVSVRAVSALCHDDATGMPHPDQITVRVDDSTLHGCGGDPRSLLAGGEWLVEDINGQGVIDNSHASLRFAADGGLSGNASCNSFHGSYKLTGEGLSIGQVAATLKACVPALDNQERKFFSVLNAVQRFDIDSDGRLILHAAGNTHMTATRAHP